MRLLGALAVLATTANAYFLFGMKNLLTIERMDPIVNPGKQSGHCHAVVGGSNFRITTNTSFLRQSACTTSPIQQDKSVYWFPNLYFQWKNGSFTSLDGGVVIYYLFGDKSGTTTAFPDDFRMISGDPYLRTYDAKSYAQQAVTFLCLDFSGKSVKYNELPPVACPSGIRAQINFPSCWDGKNVDSPDHKSHVAFRAGGPDSGDCTDPKFPVNLPRLFMEVYWGSHDFDSLRSQAMNPNQPFVYSDGDPTGYGYHADFFNGWDRGVLQKVVDNCHCNPFGDATCCADQGLFTLKKDGHCRITKTFDEQTTGTMPKLPGNNPVQPSGTRATVYPNDVVPRRIDPVYAYTGDTPTTTGHILIGVGSMPTSTTSSVAPTSTTSTSTSTSTTTTTTTTSPKPPATTPNNPPPPPASTTTHLPIDPPPKNPPPAASSVNCQVMPNEPPPKHQSWVDLEKQKKKFMHHHHKSRHTRRMLNARHGFEA